MAGNEKLTIHEVVRQIESITGVELIDVPVEGDAITLLRTRSMPEYAFVMWVHRNTSTLSQMVFRAPSHDRYPVVCACCPSAIYGMQSPTEDAVERDKWEKEMASRFKQALISTCQACGVKTLFMRRAEAWSRQYGNTEGLAIVEASKHRDAMYELYGRKIVSDALQFIDYSSSQGLNDR